MRLSELGEFGLIHRIQNFIGEPSEDVVLGLGDDAAVLRIRPGHQAVLTTDTLVEGVHFDRAYTPVESLGWKSLAINISDVAAMGGIPRFAVAALALPERWSVEDVEEFYRGMERCGSRYGCAIVGGDTVHIEETACITVTVMGEIETGRAVQRGGAGTGDLVCVTGKLGGSRAGLEVLSSQSDREEFRDSVNRFLEPEPRVREARAILEALSPTSMIDISDGLASEMHHLCRQSGVGCLIEEEDLPVSGEVFRWTEEKGGSPVDYALGSGEEYELLFTVGKKACEQTLRQEFESLGTEVTVIGKILQKAAGIKIRKDGKTRPLNVKGWDHFVSC